MRILTKQEVFGVAGEAVIFSWAGTVEAAGVAPLALPVIIHERVRRAVAEELAVIIHIFPHVGATGQARGRAGP